MPATLGAASGFSVGGIGRVQLVAVADEAQSLVAFEKLKGLRIVVAARREFPRFTKSGNNYNAR